MIGFLLHALCGLLLVANVSTAPTANSDGICSTYVVQQEDTGESIAKVQGITVAEIEKYNIQTFDWDGCNEFNQGKFICVSAGEPPMPVALANAVCGPQVPGTARPSEWSDLASLNPCPSNKCCMKDGSCALGPFCFLGTCLSNCPAPEIFATKTTPTTSISKSTVSVETTTKTETATITQQQMSTTTSETPMWTLAAYLNTDCDATANYYLLEGPTSDDCIDIRKGGLSQYSDTGVSCRYYTDGGFTTSSCDGIPENDVWSHVLTGGICLVYADDCTSSGGVSQSLTSYEKCSTVSPFAPGAAITWRSIRCTALDD